MKKLLIAIPIVMALAGCSSNPDAKFADHAPGADSAPKLTGYETQKPAIPTPPPTTSNPQIPNGS